MAYELEVKLENNPTKADRAESEETKEKAHAVRLSEQRAGDNTKR